MIAITTDKTKSITKMMEIIRERQRVINDWQTPLGMIATQLYKSVIRNFRQQGTDEKEWRPLSDITINLRRKGKGRGTPRILQDTGTLMNSIIPVYDDKMAKVGTTLNYAPIHQFGIGRRRINIPAFIRKDGVKVKSHNRTMPPIPARPFMVLNQPEKEKIFDIAKKVIQGEL